jgi:hypothetical protein
VLLLEVLQLLTCSCHPLKLDKQLLKTVHIFQGQLFFKVSRKTIFSKELTAVDLQHFYWNLEHLLDTGF